MNIKNIKNIKNIHPYTIKKLEEFNIKTLRPSQKKSLNSGLLEGKNLLVCTPTASGKTLIAEILMTNTIMNFKEKNESVKALYLVPLKALASEKFHSFTKKYPELKIALSISDVDRVDKSLEEYDIIILTVEKLDALMRHKISWIEKVKVVVIDEIHLLNDPNRGPTLEVILTLLKLKYDIQILGLSATIGNPEELAGWLNANLILDDWRPVKLKKGILKDNTITFFE